MSKTLSKKDFVSISLAIFSMLFGAGNLIYPLVVGKNSGNLIFFGIAGFILTSVLLPIAGIIGIILFDGDYVLFFNRMGKRIGSLFILASMIIIGPLIGIPRIVTLSHTMIAPFIPIPFIQEINTCSSFVFCLIFLGITFFASFRENKIVDILGYVVAPALLATLVIIIGKGILFAPAITQTTHLPFELFKNGFIAGYETLDLVASIFFASIIITLLKQKAGNALSTRTLAFMGLKTGLIGVSLLGVIYVGMAFLGAFYGYEFEGANSGELFQLISFAILGSHGAVVISIAVLMACLSTAIALSAVVGDYIQHAQCNNKITYLQALIITLVACIPLSIFGLGYVLQLTGGPITYIGYPVLITLTFCNIAYKACGFKYIKIPVAITFVVALVRYIVV